MFHYLTAGSIQKWTREPMEVLLENFIPEFLILSGVGIGALILALFVFEHRELAYCPLEKTCLEEQFYIPFSDRRISGVDFVIIIVCRMLV